MIKNKRLFDLVVVVLLLLLVLFPMLLIGIAVRLTSNGPALYWSKRVGRENVIFMMPKFRSMQVGTPNVATHLMQDANKFLTPLGDLLRRFSLDELPQLFSIIKGDMSFVGPRPALFNQDDLIALRNKNGIDKLTPGITGWAQINGRDSLSIGEKVAFEVDYLQKQSIWFDLHILRLTIIRVIKKDGISH